MWSWGSLICVVTGCRMSGKVSVIRKSVVGLFSLPWYFGQLWGLLKLLYRQSGYSAKLAIHPNPGAKSRKREALQLCSLYAFTVWCLGTWIISSVWKITESVGMIKISLGLCTEIQFDLQVASVICLLTNILVLQILSSNVCSSLVMGN